MYALQGAYILYTYICMNINIDIRSIYWYNSTINKGGTDIWARNKNWHFTKEDTKRATKHENMVNFPNVKKIKATIINTE